MTTTKEHKKLNLFDATLLVAGSMIGSGIFIVSADMSRWATGSGWLLLMWALTGVITILAALSYGELAGMMPKAGGQYVYLREAYNPLIAFLYGWAAFLIIQSGTIAAVAVAFAKFTGVLFSGVSENNILLSVGGYTLSAAQILAVVSVLLLTFLNTLGIEYGKTILRIFTSAKLIALFGIIVLGILVASNAEVLKANFTDMWQMGSYVKDNATGKFSFQTISSLMLVSVLGTAMVGSLFSSDAWNNVTFIAGEIDQPQKNIPRSLLLGTVIVTIIYILANVAYLSVLPFHGNQDATDVLGRGIQFAQNERVGVAAATMIFGGVATIIMAVLCMVSTFGCNNGIIMASARVYQEMSKDGLFFNKMKENNSNGVPAFALWTQCVWICILCLSGKYGTLLDFVMFGVMIFYILTITGVFILRRKKPDAARPYKTLGYPVLPALYILLASLFCLNLLYTQSFTSFIGLAIILSGIPIYYLWANKTKA